MPATRRHSACSTGPTIEDVLVAKVRAMVPKDVIKQRYEQINAFEKMLATPAPSS